MLNSQKASTAMALLPLACLCLLACSAVTSANENGPVVITVEEGIDALLPCSLSTKENIESQLFDWKKNGQKDARNKEVFLYDAGKHYNNGRPGQSDQFKRRVTHFQEELQHGNASILIKNTKVADSGDYTCDFPRLQPRQTFHIKLVVGAVPEPSVKTLNATKDWALLQCVVRGNPKPKVEWKDSAGNILPAAEPQVSERGGSFYVTLNIIVNKTGHFRCVATQEEISHQIHTETYIYISEETSSNLIIGVVVGIIGVVFGVAGIVFGVFKARSQHLNTFTNRSNQGLSGEESNNQGNKSVPLADQ